MGYAPGDVIFIPRVQGDYFIPNDQFVLPVNANEILVEFMGMLF